MPSIDLAWPTATDNLGVTGYRVERCQGASCTNFAQIGTPTVTTFSDTGLNASTTYRYQIRAADAAGNLGHIRHRDGNDRKRTGYAAAHRSGNDLHADDPRSTNRCCLSYHCHR